MNLMNFETKSAERDRYKKSCRNYFAWRIEIWDLHWFNKRQ